MVLSFKINYLNIHQSYFKGKVEFRNDEFDINIQDERRGKVLKLPFRISTKKDRILVMLSGPGEVFIEDYLPFKGQSEWLEIDSDEITYYVADHQDQLDILEILDD